MVIDLTIQPYQQYVIMQWKEGLNGDGHWLNNSTISTIGTNTTASVFDWCHWHINFIIAILFIFPLMFKTDIFHIM
jgi:hypothetical protein